jgi:hypothetical protein
MARRVGDDELALVGGEGAVGDIDVMPCSRSAASPSTSSAKSRLPPWVPIFLESASSAESWSSKSILAS